MGTTACRNWSRRIRSDWTVPSRSGSDRAEESVGSLRPEHRGLQLPRQPKRAGVLGLDLPEVLEDPVKMSDPGVEGFRSQNR